MKFKKNFSTFAQGCGYAVAAALLMAAIPASAEDIDPFQLDTGHWMSFDHYKEKTKRDKFLAENPADNRHSETAADTPLNPDAPAITPPVMAVAPVVAPPARPLDLPVMPGMNKGYSLRVESTQDDKPPVARITNLDDEPTVQIPASNWQSAAEAARRAQKKGEDSDEFEHQPLDIRMSFLPNRQITPIPNPERKSNHGRAPAVIAAAKAKTLPKSAADAAACAAIDAYKKQQLEAIQSDRETLTALQAAITQLGLQKQLSFMTGATGSLVSQTNTAPANLDLPAAAATTAPAPTPPSN